MNPQASGFGNNSTNSGPRRRALVTFSDSQRRETLIRILAECGVEPVVSSTVGEAQALLSREMVALVFCETDLSDGTFYDVLRASERTKQRPPVVVCSRFYDKDAYIEAMSMGAFDFVAFPLRRDEMEWIVGNALRKSLAPASASAHHAA